jgi:hypothetical protein
MIAPQEGGVVSDFNLNPQVDLVELYRMQKPAHLLLCTHTLSLGYIEHEFLSRFRRDYGTKITVVASSLGIASSFDESFSSAGPGTDYWVYELPNWPYVFHPKVFLAIEGDGSMRLILGGANFTYPGMCLNADTVCQMDLDSISEESASCLDEYLEALLRSVPCKPLEENLGPFRKSIGSINIVEMSTQEFMSNHSESILSELARHTNQAVIRIRIVSPFYDPKMTALRESMSAFSNAPTAIVCNASDTHVNLWDLPTGCKAYQSGLDRYVHAKVVILDHDNDASVMVGSANCTSPGLLQTHSQGNWETAVLTRHVSKDHADALWQEFAPRPVAPADFWSFSSTPTQETDQTRALAFSAYLFDPFMEIAQHRPFPGEFLSCRVLLTLVNGKEVAVDVGTPECLSRLDVHEHHGAIGDDDPIQVTIDIRTKDETLYRGRCWLHRSAALGKSRQTRDLEEKLRRAANRENSSWDGLEDVLSFVLSNLGQFSVGRRNSGKWNAEGTHRSQGTLEVTRVVDGSWSAGLLDDTLGNYHALEYIGLRTRLIDFLENGLQKIVSDDANDDETDSQGNFAGKLADSGRNAKYSLDEEDPGDEDPNGKLKEFLESIDDLRPYFKEGITESFREAIRDKTLDSIRRRALLSRVADLTSLCMKIVRGLRVQLPSIAYQSTSDTRFHHRFFIEMDALVETLLKIGKAAVQDESGTEPIKLLCDLLRGYDTHTDFLMYALERWNAGWHYAVRRGQKKDSVGPFLRKLIRNIGKDDALAIVTAKLFESDIGAVQATKFIISTPQASGLLGTLLRSRRLEKKLSLLFTQAVRYSFWKKARADHLNAFSYYDSHPEITPTRQDWHAARKDQANDEIAYLQSSVFPRLGRRFDERLKVGDSICLVDELKSANGRLWCPLCECRVSDEIVMKLNEMKPDECQSCGVLIVPSSGRLRVYGINSVGDATWSSLTGQR